METKTCEYCEAPVVCEDEILGDVCQECLEAAQATYEATGRYAVSAEEDYDLIRDARDGY